MIRGRFSLANYGELNQSRLGLLVALVLGFGIQGLGFRDVTQNLHNPELCSIVICRALGLKTSE